MRAVVVTQDLRENKFYVTLLFALLFYSGFSQIIFIVCNFFKTQIFFLIQVYSWGDNSCGQLGRKKSMAIEPKKVRVRPCE